jgi:hypothetical protein
MNKLFPCVALLAGLLCGGAAPPGTPAAKLEAAEAQFPPWQKNDTPEQGLVFTVPPADNMADFHGSLDNPALVLYASGN